ncbi:MULTISPECIES: hypothetical protein [unclassified Niallia]|uniref:hypothetical protein n=1 Tax=unclassified Niallia TaxID=2837522 RepID=UPI001EDAF43A|nr:MULTISPECIES: hypothetical protein [unclassified Niallia]MCM3030856.1 hypothetical protein [Niallia sp. MER 6]UPO90596.1 hypothetical protein L8T27_021345 [Niallia sp. Man26]
MKKIISIVLVAIIVVSISYYSFSKESNDKTESVITDKNGNLIEPISSDNNNIGH